jgi:hypothetical protein
LGPFCLRYAVVRDPPGQSSSCGDLAGSLCGQCNARAGPRPSKRILKRQATTRAQSGGKLQHPGATHATAEEHPLGPR